MSLNNDIINTPHLWSGLNDFGIQQFEVNHSHFNFQYISDNLRLGMYVEQVIFQTLENNLAINILGRNIQVIENNITLGEIDCILKENDTYTHLEIVYKFYLFDPRIDVDELNCWIGPNRKDSLMEKVNKLRNKQFPLLYHNRTREVLSQMTIDSNKCNQKVCFKAQLYIPFNISQKDFTSINNECIVGYYYRLSELKSLKDAKFHIPDKLHWVANPKNNINWISFDMFYTKVELLINEKRSPLCFVKDKKGNLSKCFIVWWD